MSGNDDLGGPFGTYEEEERRFVEDHLVRNLRERVCGWPSYERNPDGSAKHGFDHGHTGCYLMGLAADEIERLRSEVARLHKMAYLTIRKPRWWPNRREP